jgi:hypothetical protein
MRSPKKHINKLVYLQIVSRLSQQAFERIDLNSVQNSSMSDQPDQPKSNSNIELSSQHHENDIPAAEPQAVSVADNNYNNDHHKTISKEIDDEAETSWLNQVLQHD